MERGGEAAQTVGRLRVVVPLREGSGEIGTVGEDRRGAEMLLCGARGAYICRKRIGEARRGPIGSRRGRLARADSRQWASAGRISAASAVLSDAEACPGEARPDTRPGTA